MGCDTVINQPFPSGEEAHGCPFKNYDKDNLGGILRAYNIDAKDLKDILAYAENNHHQMGCQKLFIAMHPGMNDADIPPMNHPMEFYKGSVQYWAAKEKRPKAEEKETKAEPETPLSATAEA